MEAIHVVFSEWIRKIEYIFFNGKKCTLKLIDIIWSPKYKLGGGNAVAQRFLNAGFKKGYKEIINTTTSSNEGDQTNKFIYDFAFLHCQSKAFKYLEYILMYSFPYLPSFPFF